MDSPEIREYLQAFTSRVLPRVDQLTLSVDSNPDFLKASILLNGKSLDILTSFYSIDRMINPGYSAIQAANKAMMILAIESK